MDCVEAALHAGGRGVQFPDIHKRGLVETLHRVLSDRVRGNRSGSLSDGSARTLLNHSSSTRDLPVVHCQLRKHSLNLVMHRLEHGNDSVDLFVHLCNLKGRGLDLLDASLIARDLGSEDCNKLEVSGGSHCHDVFRFGEGFSRAVLDAAVHRNTQAEEGRKYISQTSAEEALPRDRFQHSGRPRHAPVDQTFRADDRDADADIVLDCAGW
jgi:hypothetical protein